MKIIVPLIIFNALVLLTFATIYDTLTNRRGGRIRHQNALLLKTENVTIMDILLKSSATIICNQRN